MSNHESGPLNEIEPVNDEGGLRAPPGLTGWRKAWWWFDFIILVKLARLRFVAVLVLIGAIITQWDLLTAYYDRWIHDSASGSATAGDVAWSSVRTCRSESATDANGTPCQNSSRFFSNFGSGLPPEKFR